MTTKLYRVFVTSTAMPLETVSAKDHKVRALYPQRNEELTAILIKEIEWPPSFDLE